MAARLSASVNIQNLTGSTIQELISIKNQQDDVRNSEKS